MYTKKLRFITIVLAIVFTCAAATTGCGNSAKIPDSTTGAVSSSPPSSSPSSESSSAMAPDESASAENPAAEGAPELYEFTLYRNYDWIQGARWGQDEQTKYLESLFNIRIDLQKPDGDPTAKMNLMIASNDLPDAIMMDKGYTYQEMAKKGMLVPLDGYISNAKGYKPLDAALNLEKIDGHSYCLLNFYLSLIDGKIATAGNYVWAISKKVYELAGSPPLKTIDDVYDYAVKVRDTVPEVNGGPVIPMFFENGMLPHQSFGTLRDAVGQFFVPGGDSIKHQIYNPDYLEAIVWQNKMVRENLANSDFLTMTLEQA